MKFPLLALAAAAVLGDVSSHILRENSAEPRFDVNTDIFLNLYTRENPTVFQNLINGDTEVLLASNYNSSKPVKFLVHGWNGMPESPEFTAAFLAADDCNVIMVDWSIGAAGPEPPVLLNAPLVGKWLATFIDWLSTHGPVFRGSHLVGISLGSHVVGFAGRNCQEGKVEYITVCDPSNTSWEDNDERINPGDAKYVEVIHSNTASAGLKLPTGHTDFYPNGGSFMPGCTETLCSHLRAFEYFFNSIDNTLFVAQECTNYAELESGACANLSELYMGGTKPKARTGVFYLETNAEKPYYKI